MQNKYVKISMGLDRNIPTYIWQTKTGRHGIEIESKIRASKYLLEVLEIKEERWFKLCLSEELRRLGNNAPAEWIRDLKGALVEAGETLGLTMRGAAKTYIEGKLKRAVITRMEQEVQEKWSRIQRYCKEYQYMKIELRQYWGDPRYKGRAKSNRPG